MLHRLVESLAEPEEHRAEVVVRGRNQLHVTFGLVQRLAEQRLGGAQVVVVSADERQPDQRLSPGGAGLQPDRTTCSSISARACCRRIERRECRLHRAQADLPVVLRWRHPRGLLVELGGGRRGAARLRSPCRVLDRPRHRLVGSRRRERQVPGLLLGIDDQVRRCRRAARAASWRRPARRRRTPAAGG